MAKYPNRRYQCFGAIYGRCVILNNPYPETKECPFFKPDTEITQEAIENDILMYHLARWESD